MQLMRPKEKVIEEKEILRPSLVIYQTKPKFFGQLLIVERSLSNRLHRKLNTVVR